MAPSVIHPQLTATPIPNRRPNPLTNYIALQNGAAMAAPNHTHSTLRRTLRSTRTAARPTSRPNILRASSASITLYLANETNAAIRTAREDLVAEFQGYPLAGCVIRGSSATLQVLQTVQLIRPLAQTFNEGLIQPMQPTAEGISLKHEAERSLDCARMRSHCSSSLQRNIVSSDVWRSDVTQRR